jgi:hypothetical protein
MLRLRLLASEDLAGGRGIYIHIAPQGKPTHECRSWDFVQPHSFIRRENTDSVHMRYGVESFLETRVSHRAGVEKFFRMRHSRTFSVVAAILVYQCFLLLTSMKEDSRYFFGKEERK